MRFSERITPIWLRPVAITAIGLLHAGIFVGVPWPDGEPPAVTAPLAVRVVPMGQTAEAIAAPETAQVAEVTAVEAQPSHAQPTQANEVEPTKEIEALAATDTQVNPVESQRPDRPDAESREVKPAERPEKVEKIEREAEAEEKVAEIPALVPEAAVQATEADATELTAVQTIEPNVPQPEPRPKITERKPDRRERTARRSTAAGAPSQASAVAHQSRAQAVTGSIASANYRSIVAAELNRRKFYPPAARASGIEGTVVVTFAVGGSGRVSGHRIVRSSGQAVLDRAVDRMMAAVSLPPPPGGVFRATVPIRFGLR